MELGQRHENYHRQVPGGWDRIEEDRGAEVRAGFDRDSNSGQDYARNQIELVSEREPRLDWLLVHNALRCPKQMARYFTLQSHLRQA